MPSTPRRWSSAAATKGRPACGARRATVPSTAPISATPRGTSSAPSASVPHETELPRLKVRVIINRGGGSFGEDSADKLRPLFDAQGIEAEIVAVEPGDLDRHCTK